MICTFRKNINIINGEEYKHHYRKGELYHRPSYDEHKERSKALQVDVLKMVTITKDKRMLKENVKIYGEALEKICIQERWITNAHN